jgi:hypothetical protein
VFAKGNEYAFESAKKLAGGYTEARSRIIANPGKEFFYKATVMSKSIFYHIKKVCPCIVSGLNEDTLAAKLKTICRRLLRALAIDGSSHDSH